MKYETVANNLHSSSKLIIFFKYVLIRFLETLKQSRKKTKTIFFIYNFFNMGMSLDYF